MQIQRMHLIGFDEKCLAGFTLNIIHKYHQEFQGPEIGGTLLYKAVLGGEISLSSVAKGFLKICDLLRVITTTIHWLSYIHPIVIVQLNISQWSAELSSIKQQGTGASKKH